jgi:DNA-binding transcriptional regulator YiaG
MTPSEIRTLRAALGLTQQALANRMGVTVTTVSRWEQGVRPLEGPALKLLEMLRDRKIKI